MHPSLPHFSTGIALISPLLPLKPTSFIGLELVLSQRSAPSDTPAVLTEPVLGEGGYVTIPNMYLEGFRKICDKHEIWLIVDEVQSSFARTGKYFTSEWNGIRPGIMTVAAH